MDRTLGRSLVAVGAATVLGVSSAGAQGIEGQVGRFYEGAGWDLFRLGYSGPLTGMLGLGLHGDYMRRADGADGGFAGLSADITAFRGGSEGPYLVAGVGAGMGSPHSTDFSSVWGSVSAGAGYELFPASFLAVGAEARWREVSLDAREGLQLGVGLSIRFGGTSRERPPQATAEAARPAAELPDVPPGAEETVAKKPALLRDSVVATARSAMGKPYRLGGTGEDGGGFDCSGLIQYAYGEHGITLPRTSKEQAKQGSSVRKRLTSLEPGDLLTFSNRGGRVSHVGLYVGDGRFIHSASRGVQISILSGEDPYGRWWYKRWVGVRRIIQD